MPHFASGFRRSLSGTKALSVALGFRDQATQQHADRVVGLSQALGHACQLTLAELSLLRVAATFHDVGKIGIPDRILHKPGRLDSDERQQMLVRSEIGGASSPPASLMAPTAPRESFVIIMSTSTDAAIRMASPANRFRSAHASSGVCDSYDAMGAARSYQNTRSHRDIMAILAEESGSMIRRSFARLAS